MDKTTELPRAQRRGARRRRDGTKAKLVIDEERRLKADVPPGSRFKGYAGFVVQDLVIRPRVTLVRRECWRIPDGRTVRAPLPDGIEGHFGPELRRFVLAQYHQGQVTVPRLVALLRGFGILISKRQVVRLLIAGKQRFLDEAQGVLRAGLANAACISPSTTPGRTTKPGTVSAPRLAARGSPGSGPPVPRAGSTSWNSCAPAMAITSSMTKRCLTCADGPSPHR